MGLCGISVGIGFLPVQNLLLDIPMNNVLVEFLDEGHFEAGGDRPLATVFEHRRDPLWSGDSPLIGFELRSGFYITQA